MCDERGGLLSGRNLTSLKRLARFPEVVHKQKISELLSVNKLLEQRISDESEKWAAHEHVMIHQARRAAMGDMIGAIAHQWRQPLNVLSLLMESMKETLECGEFDGKAMEYSISIAMEQVRFMADTTDDFRNFFISRSAAERFCPKRCVEEMVAMMNGCFSSFETISIDIIDELEKGVEVPGCRNEFKQVLQNLLCNARDAVLAQPEGNRKGRIVIRIGSGDASVAIGVEDNGGGVDQAILERIFEPYFTTKSETNGSGIGLYLSKVIIENKMHGSLRAENVPDGALFVMNLPVAPPSIIAAVGCSETT